MGTGQEELRKHQVFQKQQFNHRVKETVTDVKASRGQDNGEADCLSRNPLEEEEEDEVTV